MKSNNNNKSGYSLYVLATGVFVCVRLLMAQSARPASIEVPSAGFSSISAAMVRANAGDTIWVKDGVYRENVFVKSGVTVAARNLHKATINGKGRKVAITLGKRSSVLGLKITNATIGVLSTDEGNSIRNCLIVNNWQSGVVCAGHLAAIEDNVIAFNRGSGIQLWDVRSAINTINHNTIAFNCNHGIAIGGESIVSIENNIIAFNERYGVKFDARAYKDIHITNNNFYANLTMHQGIAAGNFVFNPMFISARSNMDFNLDPKSPCIAKGSDGSNLGARIVF